MPFVVKHTDKKHFLSRNRVLVNALQKAEVFYTESDAKTAMEQFSSRMDYTKTDPDRLAALTRINMPEELLVKASKGCVLIDNNILSQLVILPITLVSK